MAKKYLDYVYDGLNDLCSYLLSFCPKFSIMFPSLYFNAFSLSLTHYWKITVLLSELTVINITCWVISLHLQHYTALLQIVNSFKLLQYWSDYSLSLSLNNNNNNKITKDHFKIRSRICPSWRFSITFQCFSSCALSFDANITYLYCDLFFTCLEKPFSTLSLYICLKNVITQL